MRDWDMTAAYGVVLSGETREEAELALVGQFTEEGYEHAKELVTTARERGLRAVDVVETIAGERREMTFEEFEREYEGLLGL